MDAGTLAKILAVIGTIGGLVTTQQDMVSAKYAPLIGLIALACTASAGVFKKFTGHWAVTIIGAGIAVSGAIVPFLADIHTAWAQPVSRWATFAGIALAAVGKGFFGVDNGTDGQES